MELKTVYVTVGTTKFDDLISTVLTDEVLTALEVRGCKKIIIQYGKGKRPEVEKPQRYGFEVEAYKFKFGPERVDIIEADLVIGHPGAGTCMDILRHNKPGLLIVNNTLMDNHQEELANQLDRDCYLFRTSLDDLTNSLLTLDFVSGLATYEKGKGIPKLISYLVDMMENVDN